MAKQTDNTELIEPYNPTDPIVKFDPELAASNIVKRYEDSDPDSNPGNKLPDNSLKVDAVRFPLVKLNNKVIDKAQIKSFDMQISGFLPTIKLEINDKDNNIQATDVPGMNNVITIIMIAPVDGANKKISIDFYITECDFHDGIVKYSGEYKLITLKQSKCTQIGDSELTTYQLLESIAKECKLGFASTDNCENIDDKRWRQIYSQTYKDYITTQLSLGGLDEYSIFDAWIDQFGYLVMVNLPYIMNENVDANQLTIKMIGGEGNTENSDKLPEQSVFEIHRMITNKTGEGINNLQFNKHESIVNNDKMQENGTLNTLWVLKNPGIENSLESKQIQIIENSVDGNTGAEEYQFDKAEFIGVEMCETPMLMQQHIIKNYMLKIAAKTLYVEMPKPNYTLQRGMLLNVIVEEYDPVNKKTIMDNWDNALNSAAVTDDTPNEPENQDVENENVIESNAVVNPGLSGLYYINKVGFMYKENDAEITQYMYLYKKGLQSNVINKYAASKINLD